jgi:altronate dehydratase small subunit
MLTGLAWPVPSTTAATTLETEMQTSAQIDAIMLNERDNVATALRVLAAGDEARVGVGERRFSVPVRQAIAFGHKLAVCDIARGADVLKYGEIIGRATEDIPAGMHAHVHNIESLRGRGDLETRGGQHGV